MTEQTIVKPANPQAALNCTDKQIAEQATIQSFLNCYLREIGIGKINKIIAQPLCINGDKTEAAITEVFTRTGTESLICCKLSHQGVQLLIGLRYWSPTGRHLFSFPVYYQPAGDRVLELDYVTLVALITKELALVSGSNSHQDELLLRVIQSCSNIEQFVQQRRQDERLYTFNSSFIATEQALVFGHHLHPTPKSRQVFSEQELFTYSPELQGSFRCTTFAPMTQLCRKVQRCRRQLQH